ncbi:hypothetical protein [Microbacterium hominis]|uniref:Uncharacterized protein n=1 Tax=Microbacterium hominis TaxID=162426 RepID=A0A7D4Q1D3_9MICO|nr:hypothetical protein [Microbacterium hominis]QKJ19732.1 hypothetical protein HQM25_10400 [Microbacterium hominis]
MDSQGKAVNASHVIGTALVAGAFAVGAAMLAVASSPTAGVSPEQETSDEHHFFTVEPGLPEEAVVTSTTEAPGADPAMTVENRTIMLRNLGLSEDQIAAALAEGAFLGVPEILPPSEDDE